MGAAKKLEMTPDEELLQEALRTGRATKQDISMKVIKPDVSLQARVQHLDLDHCRRLERSMEATGNLAPIVLFVDAKTGKYFLADGHHRHYVYKNAKRDSIPAYVITSNDPHQEALEFATMCNREMCLGRKPEDIRRAVEMLFANEKWWKKSVNAIGNHVGCNGAVVAKCRLQWSRQNNVPIPDKVETVDGRLAPVTINSKRNASPVDARIVRQGEKDRFIARFRNKEISGKTEQDVRQKLEEIAQEDERAKRVLSYSRISYILTSKGFSVVFRQDFHPHGKRQTACRAWSFGNVICRECDFSTHVSLSTAIGDLVAAESYLEVQEDPRIVTDGFYRRVVICNQEDGPAPLIDLYKRKGFEFLTPDELVASLGDEA